MGCWPTNKIEYNRNVYLFVTWMKRQNDKTDEPTKRQRPLCMVPPIQWSSSWFQSFTDDHRRPCEDQSVKKKTDLYKVVLFVSELNPFWLVRSALKMNLKQNNRKQTWRRTIGNRNTPKRWWQTEHCKKSTVSPLNVGGTLTSRALLILFH